MIKGEGISNGIGIGVALVIKKEDRNISGFKIEDSNAEISLLENALNDVKKETQKLINELSGQEKEIMEAHLMILEDPTLIEETKRLIKEEKYNMGYSIETGINQTIQMFEMMDDEYLSERAADIRDIKNRILEKILNEKTNDLSNLNENTIIIAKELTTSDTAKLNFKNVAGIITEIGGKTSHTSIMAKAHSIPAISFVEDVTNIIQEGQKIGLNGNTGEIFINPTSEELNKLEKIKKELDEGVLGLEEYRGKSTVTKDGKKVELFANIGNLEDSLLAIENDAEGVGLLRSEFLYMETKEAPTEEEQFEKYKEVATSMKGKEVIIRTLDVGGDKQIKYLNLPEEPNPFLGYRAIRVCLDKKDIFKTQLRALLRASTYGNISIMFPMISSIEELREAKDILEECKKELGNENIKYNENIKVGIMIEIPGAALNAENLAKECDFFSIGTNDLIQYSVAVERGNEKVSKLYTKYHPGVIKLIKMTIDGAHKEGIKCGMCGEASASEALIPVLIGLGLDEFSMRSNNILRARKKISELNSIECIKLAEEIMNMSSAIDIENRLKNK